METNFIIYKITNKINGKIYVGKTCDYNNRMYLHNKYPVSVISKAIQKYGKENFLFDCKMRYRGKIYTKSFKSLTEAAELYDMLLMYFYGEDCIVNFPDKLEKYLNSPIYKDLLNYVQQRRSHYSSKFNGVTWKDKFKKWYSYYYDNNERQISIGLFHNERAAALMRDIVIIVRGIKQKINFKEHLIKISKNKIIYLYNRHLFQLSPLNQGVTYNESQKKWQASFIYKQKVKYIGKFITESEAKEARDNFIKLNKLFTLIPITTNDFIYPIR